MKINNRIPYNDVLYTTKDICEYITGEEHTILSIPIELRDEEKLKDYISVIVCKENEKDFIKAEILANEGLLKNEYIKNIGYCHITTYEANNMETKDISFDINDDYPIKASFNSPYSEIEQFFKNFIKFRNNLIKKNQIVKDDDINQYFQSVTGFTVNNRDTVFNSVKKKLSRK